MSQIVASDFLIGFFDLEKGFVYTLKSLFTRPGHFVREYVQGKRRTYFHFLTFLLIILGIYVFLDEFPHVKPSQLLANPEGDEVGFLQEYEAFGKKYPRLLLLIAIPFTSIVSYFWFKKAQYNFAEHIILNTFKSSGELIIAMLFTILTIFYSNIDVLRILYSLLVVVLALYTIWFYFQYFKPDYKSKWKLVVRIFFSYLSLQIFIGTLAVFFMGFLKGFSSQL